MNDGAAEIPARAPGVVSAGIAGIATHLPKRVLTNDELAEVFEGWTAEKILSKLGIRERRVAAADETASDLAFAAGRKLLDSESSDPKEVDFLIFCTQAPDYFLPTSACVLQERLGLPRGIGAVDINLGCSGFVYGLSLAVGMIASGAARNVLLLTADTYSKFIHQRDRSVRTLFGDGAAATMITARARPTSRIGPFVFGTDGRGARNLIVETGASRTSRSVETSLEVTDEAGNVRARDNLYMNGAAVMSFTLREVPKTAQELYVACNTGPHDYDYFVAHQANKFLLDALENALDIPPEKFPRFYESIGNTVSSTIPFVLADLIAADRLRAGTRLMLLGFGVGLSWAGADVIW